MFACMDAPLKNLCAASLRITETRLITSWVKYRLLAYVKFSNSHSFISIPTLTIVTVPNWLTVKFHCSLIGSTVKNLNTFFLLAVT
jgi:hypothetical protein